MKALRWVLVASLLMPAAKIASQNAVTGLPPDILVARAAAAVSAISFDRVLEEQALRDLASALRQEPRNERARALVELIQKRRRESEVERQQKGQQQLRNQQTQPQNQSAAQESESQRRRDDGDEGRTGTNQPARNAQGNPLTREQAQQLLDALEHEDRRPMQAASPQNLRRGPRW